MSRKSQIRWRKSDTEQLARRVKNFNAKITRLEKKHPEIADLLPKRVSAKTLKEDISTRSDYNKIIKALAGFSEKGAETIIKGKGGAETTAWEYKQVQKAVQAENRARKRQQEALASRPVMISGKVYKDVRRAAADKGLAPLHTNFHQRSKQSWENFAKYMQRSLYGKSRSDEQRYYKACVDCWRANLTAKQMEELKRTMQAVGIGKCLQAYYNGVDELRPDFVYDNKYAGQSGTSVFVRIMNALRALRNLPDIQQQAQEHYMYNKNTKLAKKGKFTPK